MVKRILILLVTAAAWLMASAESADGLLKSAGEKLNSAKSINASYRVSAEGQSIKGALTVAKNRFVIDSPQLKSWFDGKTQWTYSAEIGEVNITEPTDDELAQVNPFAILNTFRTKYKSQILKTDGNSQLIEMVPVNKKSTITKLLVTIDRRTLYPSKIVIYTDGGSAVTIDVTSVSEGTFLPESQFRFDPKKFPGVEIVDLR